VAAPQPSKVKQKVAAPPLPKVKQTVWNSDQYWAKGVRYFTRMQEATQGAPDVGFFAALSLEFFARAALTAIHPALNADPRDEGEHILFAFDIAATAQPKSLPLHSVLSRLVRSYPGAFTDDMKKQAEHIVRLRNEELHSAALPFETLREEAWLAGYYAVVLAIARILRRPQRELFSSTKASAAARAMVKTARDKRVGEVKKKIGKAKHAFGSLSQPERDARQQTAAYAARLVHPSRAAKCPACGSGVVLQGVVIYVAEPQFDGEELVGEVRYSTTGMRCSACRLKLTGASEIGMAKLPPRYQEDRQYDLHRDREDDEEEEYDNM
jgi:rRNA processing protein Gar1